MKKVLGLAEFGTGLSKEQLEQKLGFFDVVFVLAGIVCISNFGWWTLMPTLILYVIYAYIFKKPEWDAGRQFNLGLMYEKGQGVEQDFKEAVKWYQKAADWGHAMAQTNLGLMYYNGQGVE